MKEELKVDLCIIGAGSGGLSVAAGASMMGASTVLIEKGKMGGDCLNYGCVPSKALLAAGHAADAVRRGGRFGISPNQPVVNGARAYGHVADTIGAIAPHDSVERFEGLGVKVVQAEGRFDGPRTVEADGFRIQARRFVVATGSRAFVPPIEGLNEVSFHTNESIFSLGAVPDHLIVIGGGPIGIEMAQAHRHLGARVTVLEMFSIMPKDDPELVDVLRKRLHEDGIDIREGVTVAKVEKAGNGLVVTIEQDGSDVRIEGSHLLVAAGRRPNVDGLGLETAGIAYSPQGIGVDNRLRTSNKKVFAIGDVAGSYQFTHVAGYHAGIVIRNALFRLPAKASMANVPWVTYTAPEVAQVGLTEQQAQEQGVEFQVLRWPFAENDRAQAEGETDGLVKVLVTPKGKILGAGIAGPHAGDLIQTWVLAMTGKLKIGAVAGMVAPYPTLGEVSKRAAGTFYTPKLFSERTKKMVRFLAKFG
ncbi:MAG: FAD-dependent oxidoreductase [Rhodospirillales bacterium]|nr:FAD-dependent oxidoreductase [Rhodospirillales bacterium]